MAKLQELFKKQSKEIHENKIRTIAIFLILLSLIFFLTTLIGSTNGSVDLNKFTFDEPISKILQRKSIKFTLLGYCIDDKCTKDVSHNFDKAPTSSEIQSGEINKRSISTLYKRFDPNEAIDKVDDVANDAKDAAEKIGEKAKDAGEKAVEFAENAAKATIQALLSAFDNFVPSEPTNGKSGWIARPIIAATFFNTLTLLSLLIANNENRKYCYPFAFITLIISLILNIISFFITFSLFSLVFNVIGSFPGIGDNRTGPAIHLLAWSAVFLLAAMSLIIIDGSRKKKKNLTDTLDGDQKTIDP